MTDYRGVRQFSREEAVAFADGGEWKDWTPAEIGQFCLYQELLCVPFASFREGVEAALGRPVFPDEFAERDRLLDELERKRDKATMRDVSASLERLTKGESRRSGRAAVPQGRER